MTTRRQSSFTDNGWRRFALVRVTSLVGVILVFSHPAQPAFGFPRVHANNQAPSRLPSREIKRGQPLSLRLIPQEIDLRGANASQRILVLGNYGDGLERDVTGQSRFSLSNPDLAQVDGTGKVTARTDGRTTLSVQFAGHVATAQINVANSREERVFSFARNVEAIFMKRGCNTGACHGGPKGKGGFKLSMDAVSPRADYKWIVEGGTFQVLTADTGPKVPRINLKDPEKSLLLLKPTFTVAHGGGRRIEEGSPDHQVLLNWIRSGAPYGKEQNEAGTQIERIELLPFETILEPEDQQQVLVTAHFADGHQEDLTDEVAYTVTDPAVLSISAEGRVKARKLGEAAVVVRVAGQSAEAQYGVISHPISPYPQVRRNNFIDDYVFGKLRRLSIVPSELSTDDEFLRRVCLGVAGALPPPERTRQFLASKDPQKREKLIHTLLQSPQYVDYWTFRFADIFRVSFNTTQNLKATKLYWDWLHSSIAQNKPYNQIAIERIAGEGYGGPTPNYFRLTDLMPANDIMAEQIRVFFGRRLDCAQCHSHPFEDWTNEQYWGLAAFFGQMARTRSGVILDTAEGNVELKDPQVMNPRTKKVVSPRFLNGGALRSDDFTDPRMKLAKWITGHPYFAQAIANRIWGYLMGRGVVEPVDDFRYSNPPSNPELLQALANEFQKSGYDVRHLIQAIVESRTYQLSGTPNETNKDDRTNYSHFLGQPLPAEVLLDAISKATGVPEKFEILEGGFGGGGVAPAGTRAISLLDPGLFPSHFLDIYGRFNRESVPEGANESSLAQALDQWAGADYTTKLAQPGSRVDRLAKGDVPRSKAIEELYLATVCRFPSTEEESRIEELMQRAPSRQEAMAGLAWALISSREFAFNH